MPPPPMLGIKELLNDRSLPEQVSDGSDDGSKFSSHVGLEPKLEVNTSNHRIDKLFRSRVHPALLRNRKLLDIALRRKLAPKRTSTAANCGLKLHRKLLEAGFVSGLFRHHPSTKSTTNSCLYRPKVSSFSAWWPMTLNAR